MTDSTRDMAIGRLEGQLELIIASNKEASEGRKQLYQKVEEISSDVRCLTERVTAMEPSWRDYTAKMNQVEGAGKLGRLLWWIGGGVLAAAAWMVGALWPPPHP